MIIKINIAIVVECFISNFSITYLSAEFGFIQICGMPFVISQSCDGMGFCGIFMMANVNGVTFSCVC